MDRFDFGEKITHKDEQIAKLQADLGAEKDKRREDKFVFVVALMILFDCFFFQSFDGWGAPVVILILQLFILLPLGKRYGVDIVFQWLNKVLNRYNGN